MRAKLSVLASFLVVCALTGCGHIPLSTMYQMRDFDPRMVDPALLRIAVRVPDALELRPGGVKLTVAYWRAGEEANKREVKLLLQEVQAPTEVAALTVEKRPGTHVHAFRINLADVPHVRALQAESSKRDGQGRSHVTLGVSADTCHRDQRPAGPIYMTTFIKTDEARGFLTLLEDIDLRSTVPKGKTLDEFLPSCTKVSGERT